MSKAAVSKLVPRVPSRRQQYSAATRRALIDVGEQLFTEHGYAAASLDAIVAGAQVTKGALYHHFSGKQALFEAVFEQVETGAARAVTDAGEGHRDPWEKALAGLLAFLDVVQQPTYRRIVILEGPAVLGWTRFREQAERSTFACVLDIVSSVLQAGDLDLDDELVETFARIFFGAMSSAGEAVSTSEDPNAAAARVEAAIGFILAGMQSQLQAGFELPSTASSD
jgi:AcrR family transcriptional regulator